MKNKIYYLLLSLWLLFMIGCSGGEKAGKPDKDSALKETKELKELVQKVIPEEERMDNILAIIEDIEKNSIEFYELHQEYRKKVHSLTQNYAATEEEFIAFYESYSKQYKAFIKQLVKNRRTIRDMVTAEEWDDLYEHMLFIN